MRESDIVNAIRLAAPKYHCTLLRNNVGCLKDATGRTVKFGLATGSSDLIGWTICNGAAIFTAIEVKLPKKHPTSEQAAFLRAVQQAGGIACVATCVDDLARAIGEWDGD
jgi:VRR-NUC domain-containing protein